MTLHHEEIDEVHIVKKRYNLSFQ